MSDQNHPSTPEGSQGVPGGGSEAGGYGAAPPPPPNPEGAPGAYGAAPPPENPYGAPADYGQAPPGGPVTRPRSMDLAVLLMRVGAVLSVLSLLSVFFLGDQIRTAVQDSMRAQGQTIDPSTIDAAVTVATVFGTVVGLLGAALWLFMAWANGKGKSWARIVSTILFGISVLGFLVGLAQPAGILERILSVISLLVGAAIIYLLYQRESSEYYRAMSAPRY